jgi:hypothetical protein
MLQRLECSPFFVMLADLRVGWRLWIAVVQFIIFMALTFGVQETIHSRLSIVDVHLSMYVLAGQLNLSVLIERRVRFHVPATCGPLPVLPVRDVAHGSQGGIIHGGSSCIVYYTVGTSSV